MTQKQKGFTLIELLVVISIIALLAVTVFVALDPVKRFADARNSRRWSDVNEMITAVHEYIVDNKGAFPAGLSTGLVATQLGSCATGGATLCSGAAAACVNLATPLAKYLKAMPFDNKVGSATSTAYKVEVDANNIVTITACASENGEVISVSR